jgi:hypothetical protein
VIASRNHPVNCGDADSEFSRTNPKRTIAQRSADIEFVTEYSPLTPGGLSEVTIGDTLYLRADADLAGTNKRIVVSYLPERLNAVRSTQSSNESILSPTVDPLLFAYEDSGTASLTVELTDGEILTKVASTTVDESQPDQFVSFVPGSLGRHIYDQVRLYANNATTAPQHYALFSTFNQQTNAYVKNTDSWAASLNWTGMMVNKVGSPGVTRVTAITPHHAIGASHYGPEAGDVIYFCDENNQTVARTISARTDLGGNTDCCIVRLSEALPAQVKTYKTLPANWEDYAPVNQESPIETRIKNWPIVVTSHYRWDAEWSGQRSGRFAYVYTTSRSSNFILFNPAQDVVNNFPNYNGVPSGIRGGDSGGPCFFIINGELALVHCFLGGNGGPFHPSFLSQIQAALDTLGPGGQTYQTVDLSEFTNFAS